MTPARISKTQRWLDLLSFLLGRRFPVSVEQIFEAVPGYGDGGDGSTANESARRKFERDKDELRTAGIAIETEKYTTGFGTDAAEGYRLRAADFYLPDIRPKDRPTAGSFSLAEHEIVVALAALREAADIPDSPFADATESALRKLAFDAGGEATAPRTVFYLDEPTEPVAQALSTISDALVRRKRLQFRYRAGGRGPVTERDVATWGVLLEAGAWYLVGHDSLREDIRTFRVDRMADLSANHRRPASPDYEIPADFSLADYRDRRAWEYGEGDDPVGVQVRFAYPWSLWAERNALGELEADDGRQGAVRRFEVQALRPFVDWVLSLAGGAEILAPESAVEQLALRAAAVVAAHEDQPA